VHETDVWKYFTTMSGKVHVTHVMYVRTRVELFNEEPLMALLQESFALRSVSGKLTVHACDSIY